MKSIISLIMLLVLVNCTQKKSEVGSQDNPIKFFMVPSVDAKLLESNAKVLKDFLEKNTSYKFNFSIPNSYIAVVESFGTKRADIASINTFGYILAHEKYGAEAKMKVLRFGQDEYKAQIITRTDSKIKSLKDIEGKKFAYVDPSSTSGFLMPSHLLKKNNINPKETVFAQKHDNVVTMVYQKQVDAGSTFYSPSENGKIQDARRLVKTQFPDIEDKVRILELTDSIPNDPIIFRKDLDEKIKVDVTQALLKFLETEEGKSTFHSIYGVTGLKLAKDEDYDRVRGMLKDLGQSANTLVK